jgi:exoribonuclease-2
MTHTKLGVSQYAWCTSPLRRAVDFINQCQLIALLRHENLPYSNAKKTLSYFAKYFDKTYDAYLVFQRQMTRCYALRWILQENLKTICGVHIGRGVFKLEHLPLDSQPIKSLDSLNIGDQIVFDILRVDEITQSIELQPLSQTS